MWLVFVELMSLCQIDESLLPMMHSEGLLILNAQVTMSGTNNFLETKTELKYVYKSTTGQNISLYTLQPII